MAMKQCFVHWERKHSDFRDTKGHKEHPGKHSAKETFKPVTKNQKREEKLTAIRITSRTRDILRIS